MGEEATVLKLNTFKKSCDVNVCVSVVQMQQLPTHKERQTEAGASQQVCRHSVLCCLLVTAHYFLQTDIHSILLPGNSDCLSNYELLLFCKSCFLQL